jgi:asparagine synthase (glutamine-hydrolysing)
MCGIFGYFNYPEMSKQTFYRMGDLLLHRGPDEAGFYKDNDFAFGIRRLSIIDLKTGSQPIFNENKTIICICNGEVYNYKELNNKLIQKGHKISTGSDIECVVHLYEDYGIDCLKYLNGMFALAIYDLANKELFIARDRLGIKPLYYSYINQRLLFASELKPILNTDLFSDELDWEGLSCYLNDMYIPSPYTPFKNIRKLRSGSFIKLKKGNALQEYSYWSLKQNTLFNYDKEQTVLENLEFQLKKSVNMRLNADVPVCAFLSGGLDSSAIVAFSSIQSSKPLSTFHVFFEGIEGNSLKTDERSFARKVADRYSTNHTEINVTKNDFLDNILKVLWHIEEPFGDLASIPTHIICQIARQNSTVCINGSGGDELFAGYPYHSKQNALRKYLREYAFNGALYKIYSRFKYYLDKQKSFQDVFPLYVNNNKDILNNSFVDIYRKDKLNGLLAVDIEKYLQSNILFLLDKVSMSSSMEGRVPLLDHTLVEYIAGVDSNLKYKKGTRKYIFKKLCEPYLPKDIIYREKEGFGAPLGDWFSKELKLKINNYLSIGFLFSNDLINVDRLYLKLLDDWSLWKIFCLELWCNLFVTRNITSDMSLSDIL